MHFDSTLFVAFIALVLCLNWSMKAARSQNMLLLLASYVFYGSWSWKFLALMVATTAIDYVVAFSIADSALQFRRRLLLTFSIVINVSILLVAKYAGFFIDEFAALLHSMGVQADLPILRFAVPAGISFYSLQSIGYVVDVYRGKQPPTRHFLDYALFVAFFPQLIAGPIERAGQLLPQLQKTRIWSRERFESGAMLALWGLLKKVVVADNLSTYVNAAYGAPYGFSGRVLVTATVFFAVQIYSELSGYVDIARGTARMLGIDLATHFNLPYFSRTPLDFWSRWQITLMQWFNDYVRMPLQHSFGGLHRRAACFGAYFLAMTLLGFWEGAHATFVLFGVYWGLVIVLYLAMNGSKPEPDGSAIQTDSSSSKLPQFAMICGTFVVACGGWIFFRAKSCADAIYIMSHLVSGAGANEVVRPEVFREPTLWCLIAGLWIVELLQRNAAAFVDALLATEWRRLLLRHLMLIAVLGSYFLAQDAAVRELIEFQF